MKGLLIKEKHSILSSCKTYFLVPLAFAAAFMVSALKSGHHMDGFPIGMIIMFTGMLPVAICNSDMPSKWHINCLTMPYSRSEIVSAKYIMTLILVGIAAAASALMILLSLAAGGHFENDDMQSFAKVMFCGISMGFMPATIFMPPNFKFYDKPQGVRLVLSMIAGGFIGGMTMMIMNAAQRSKAVFGGAFIYMIIVIVLFILSWLLSLALFRKKDA